MKGAFPAFALSLVSVPVLGHDSDPEPEAVSESSRSLRLRSLVDRVSDLRELCAPSDYEACVA